MLLSSESFPPNEWQSPWLKLLLKFVFKGPNALEVEGKKQKKLL